jgi:hypothetical protein
MSWLFPSSQRKPLSKTGSQIGIKRYPDGTREFYRKSPRERRDSGYTEESQTAHRETYNNDRASHVPSAVDLSPACDLSREEDFREAMDAFIKLAHLSELPRTQSDHLVARFEMLMVKLDLGNPRQVSAVSRHFTACLSRADLLTLPEDNGEIEEILRSMIDILT